MPKIAVSGLEVGYDCVGSGPPVVLVGGLACERGAWFGFDRRLARELRVLTYDLRATGETTGSARDYSIPRLASDLLALLDALEWERPHVVGVSMGGMIAAELALSNPTRVDRLVLGCTHSGGGAIERPAPAVLAKLPELAQGADRFAEGFLELAHTPEFLATHEALRLSMLQHRRAMPRSRRVHTAQLGAILAHDVSTRLAGLRARTLIMTGDRDELVPPGNSSALAAQIRGARLLRLEDAGHAFWVEAPEIAAQAISAFLREP